MSKMEIINIERGMPTVEEAIRRMNMGLSTARGRGMLLRQFTVRF